MNRPVLPHAVRPILALCIVAGTLFGAENMASREQSLPPTQAPLNTTDPASANRTIADLKLDLIWIKPGTFKMGSEPDEPERNQAEGPVMKVILTKGFWIGRTEMTQGQYEAIIGINPSHFPEVGKDAPVENVSWTDAMEFCAKLNARERAAGRLPDGYAYTLPTEAQWEYAYRAGTTSAYPGTPDTMGWNAKNSGETTHPVGQKQASPWGLYDMAGNVLEWCYDWYGPYPGGAQTDPTGPRSGSFHMARGGSWRMEPRINRSAERAGGSTGRRDYTLGFRLALCPVR